MADFKKMFEQIANNGDDYLKGAIPSLSIDKHSNKAEVLMKLIGFLHKEVVVGHQELEGLLQALVSEKNTGKPEMLDLSLVMSAFANAVMLSSADTIAKMIGSSDRPHGTTSVEFDNHIDACTRAMVVAFTDRLEEAVVVVRQIKQEENK